MIKVSLSISRSIGAIAIFLLYASTSAYAVECRMPEQVSGKAVFNFTCNEILYSSNKSGPIRPYVGRLKGDRLENLKPLSGLPSGDYFVRDMSADCRYVALVTDTSGDGRFLVELLDRANSTSHRISLPELRSAGDPQFSPDGQLLAYISGRSLFVHQLASKQLKARFDHRHTIGAITWSVQNDSLFVQSGDGITQYKLGGSEPELVYRAPSRMSSQGSISSDGKNLYFASDHESDFSQIYSIPIADSGKSTNPIRLFADQQDQFDPIATNDTIWFRTSVAGNVCLRSLSKSNPNQINAAPCKGVTYSFSPLLGHEGAISAVHASALSPVSVMLYNPDTSIAVDLLGLKGDEATNISTIDSGKAIPHFLFEPKRSTSSLVVWLHGGPHEHVSPRYNPFIFNLNRAGYSVLAINYPGSTGAGNTYELRKVRSDTLMAQQVSAVSEVISSFLQENPRYVEVTLLGVSYGAGIAHRVLNSSRSELRQKLKRLIDLSGKTVLSSKEIKSLEVSHPLLFIYGANDPLQRAGNRAQLLDHVRDRSQQIVLQNEGHVLRNEDSNSVACKAILNFLAASDTVSNLESGMWIQSKYFRGRDLRTSKSLKPEEVNQLALRLKKNGIKYAYIFSGPFDFNGQLPGYAFSKTAKTTVQKLNELYPELKILPWIGGLQDKSIFLEKDEWVENAILQIDKLTNDLQISGVHLDFEYVLPSNEFVLNERGMPAERSSKENYSKHLIGFNRRLRKALPNIYISVAVPTTAPNSQSWKLKSTEQDIGELSKYVDQVVLLNFDTGINAQEMFEQDLATQVQHIQNWRGARLAKFFIAFGTFINGPELQSFRNLEIENLSNSFKTLKQVSAKVPLATLPFDGIAIYSEWETDAEEWAIFRENMSSLFSP